MVGHRGFESISLVHDEQPEVRSFVIIRIFIVGFESLGLTVIVQPV